MLEKNIPGLSRRRGNPAEENLPLSKSKTNNCSQLPNDIEDKST